MGRRAAADAESFLDRLTSALARIAVGASRGCAVSVAGVSSIACWCETGFTAYFRVRGSSLELAHVTFGDRFSLGRSPVLGAAEVQTIRAGLDQVERGDAFPWPDVVRLAKQPWASSGP